MYQKKKLEEKPRKNIRLVGVFVLYQLQPGFQGCFGMDIGFLENKKTPAGGQAAGGQRVGNHTVFFPGFLGPGKKEVSFIEKSLLFRSCCVVSNNSSFRFWDQGLPVGTSAPSKKEKGPHT